MQVNPLKTFGQLIAKLGKKIILRVFYTLRFCFKCQKQLFSFKQLFLTIIIILFTIFSYVEIATIAQKNSFEKTLLSRLFFKREITIETGLPEIFDSKKTENTSKSDFQIAAWRENNILDISEDLEIALILGSSILVAPETEISETNILRQTRTQIQIYVVQPGDNPWDIANKFGLNVWTVLWANNLNYWGSQIKPGDKLKILPTDGVLHEVKKNENLSYIAKKYKSSTKQIIEFNNLTEDATLNPGQIIIIPDGSPLPAPTPIYKPKQEITPLFVATEDDDCSYKDWRYKHCYSLCHRFYWKPGQCTDWIAYKWANEQGQCVPRDWGNARTWLNNAKNDGYKVGYTPQKGVIVVLKCNNWYGHVAYVEDFDDNYIYFSEMNGPSNPSWTQKPATRKLKRTLNWQNTLQGGWKILGYIYPKNH